MISWKNPQLKEQYHEMSTIKELKEELKKLKPQSKGKVEPPRDCRRLHFLRGWSA
jgi:hypothetical protein